MNRALRRSAIAATLVGVAAAGSTSLAGSPDLSLTDPQNGRAVAVSAAPRVLHLVFFATWCPECVQELPQLADLDDRWTERGYRLVLIAVNTRQTEERLVQFLKEKQPPGRLLFDADGRAVRDMRVEQMPTHVLLDPNGAELARAGSVAEIRATLERQLRSDGPGKK